MKIGDPVPLEGQPAGCLWRGHGLAGGRYVAHVQPSQVQVSAMGSRHLDRTVPYVALCTHVLGVKAPI